MSEKTVDRKTKVLVVDDSALMRKLIPMLLSSDENLEVVGTAMDGDFAIKKIPELNPDVITLDIDMPRMDGLTTLRTIVRDFSIPVILVSSHTTDGADITLRGLELGAFDFIAKPEGAISVRIPEIAGELIRKVKAAGIARPIKFREPRPLPKLKATKIAPKTTTAAEKVVAIGISTGGPQALAEFLPHLPADFKPGILIVQHMPAGFTELFAKRLNSMCEITVKEAAHGDVLCSGMALLAPGDKHLRVKRTHFGVSIILSQSPPVNGHRPSATVLFNSVAEEFGENAVGVIMTGMGNDGVDGLKTIKDSGGMTIAQDEETSVIYGMPKVAIEKGYADKVVGLDMMAPYLVGLFEHGFRGNPESGHGRSYEKVHGS